jgi:hypothetical protein
MFKLMLKWQSKNLGRSNVFFMLATWLMKLLSDDSLFYCLLFHMLVWSWALNMLGVRQSARSEAFFLSRPIGRRQLLAHSFGAQALLWLGLYLTPMCLQLIVTGLRREFFSVSVSDSFFFGIPGVGVQLAFGFVVGLCALAARQVSPTLRDERFLKQLLRPAFYLMEWPQIGFLALVAYTYRNPQAMVPHFAPFNLKPPDIFEVLAGLTGALALYLWICDRNWDRWKVPG